MPGRQKVACRPWRAGNLPLPCERFKRRYNPGRGKDFVPFAVLAQAIDGGLGECVWQSRRRVPSPSVRNAVIGPP